MTTVEKPLFHRAIDVAKCLATRTAFVQEQVIAAARQFLDPALGERWSLVAVGGFGRGDLFPYSDADLLLLVDRDESAVEAKEAIGYFLRALWDEGLLPSHSVHTVEDCCRLDASNIELTISLLTQRHLTGSVALYSQLAEKLPAFIRAQRRAVTENLLRMASGRREKFQDTIYHLEPDIKETPGGIRDLHLIEWLGALRGIPFQESLDGLRDARHFLYAVRICLHERSKRNDNRLTFHAQDELFENPAESMREYYKHAREIDKQTQFIVSSTEEPGSGMLRSFLDWRSRLSNAEFTVSREQVLLRTPQNLGSDPQLPLRLMQFVARHGFMLARDTERRLTEAVRSPSFTLPGIGLWRELRDLLSLPHAAKAVRAMHETGLLKKILPEWSRIECLVTRDFYHRYTVDEHTLVTLENLDKLAGSKDDSYRTFRGLLNETTDVYLLRFALLMHDIGKGSGNEHSEESMRIATDVLSRLGAEPAERDMILYLIEHHLDLSSLMTSRDLHDPAVAQVAAHQIGTMERLQLLTLLTFADISAVNPTALTPWRRGQLWSAYRALHHEFTRELDTDRIGASPALAPERAVFLDGFPTRYLMVHTPEEIDEHFAMSQRVDLEGVSVRLKNQRDSWLITVITRDRPRLFADLAGALASFGMNILKAEAFGNQQGLVLDILRFSDPMRRLELNPDEANDLTRLVKRVVLGQENVKSRLAARPKTALPSRRARIQPVVGFDNFASEKATLMEVIAEDRPGLLFDLARAISEAGCNIEVILVNTEAHKALDVFYLTAANDKLAPTLQESLGQRLRLILSA